MDLSKRKLDVSVVIICHNYGKYLAEAITSVLMQTHPAAEIVVIDDASTDNTSEIAKAFAGNGVEYCYVETRNIHENRRIGLELTTCPVLCFLDADDRLSPDYLEEGLRRFSDLSVGVVYSDIQQFGIDEPPWLIVKPPVADGYLLARLNYIHAGSLVLRVALEQSGSWDRPLDINKTHEDWFMWRKVLAHNWKAVRQKSLYHYRSHEDSRFNQLTGTGCNTYFEQFNMRAEVITLFIALSGRLSQWKTLAAFLEEQTWPHDQVQLVLMDTSQSDLFYRTVRAWVDAGDYNDVRLFRCCVGAPGLADEDRAADWKKVAQVRKAAAKIYSRLASLVSTDYCWILEDDIRPPLDVCERLLRSFDQDTASVSAPYRSRYHAGFCAWRHGNIDKQLESGVDCTIKIPGCGVELLSDVLMDDPKKFKDVHRGGNGFGCVILRKQCLKEAVFYHDKDFDPLFYFDLMAKARRDKCYGEYRFLRRVKIDWSLEAEHIGAPTYSLVKMWDTSSKFSEWSVARDLDIQEGSEALHLTSTGDDPQLVSRVSLPPGEYRARVICKAATCVKFALYWKTKKMSGWSADSCTPVDVLPSDEFVQWSIPFHSKDEVVMLRFDPHNAPGDVFIKSMALDVLVAD